MKKVFKFIYNAIPFKKEMYSALKLVWTPGKEVFKHLHFKGVIKVDINPSTSFLIRHYGYQIENEIFWLGLYDGWEKESSKLWIKLCEKSDVIVDIGANTGIYALIAKAIRPDAKVFAFEPVKRVFTKLQDNISLNNYDIVALEQAVSDSNGEAVIYDTDTEHIYSVTVNKNLAANSVKVVETKIETITMDRFIEQYNLTNVDLIKIDVETHEPEVLIGFSAYLNRYRPSMLIEILNNEVGQRVEELVHGMGYLFFNIDENGGVRKVEKITKSDYYNYLLCNAAIAKSLGLQL